MLGKGLPGLDIVGGVLFMFRPHPSQVWVSAGPQAARSSEFRAPVGQELVGGSLTPDDDPILQGNLRHDPA